MNQEIEKLSALDGVNGLFVHRGGIIKWQRRPDSLSIDNAGALCNAVSKAFATYARAERPLMEAYFEFAGQSVLVLAWNPAAGETAPDMFLTFLLRDRPAASVVIRHAAAYFDSESAN